MTNTRTTPQPTVRETLFDIAAAARTIPLLGRRFHCPCCQWSFRQFTTGGHRIRAKADGYCPRCNSKPRHRWLWLHLPESLRPDRRASTSVLHIAPAHSTYRAMTAMQTGIYVTAGLQASPRYSLRMDLTRPALKGGFDVVICVHVLEHLDDDDAALASLADLVSPHGVVMIGVPIRQGETLEDPTVTDPVRRAELFGEPDHRRWYGLDIVDRIGRSGLEVVDVHLTDDVTTPERQRCGLKPGEGLLICRLHR